MSVKKPIVLYNGELRELQPGDSLPSSGILSPALLSPSVVAGHFPNANFPAVRNISGISGNNDLYTVPAGRKALVTDFMTTNQTGFASIVYPLVWISGVYYRIGAPFSENNNAFGHNYGFSQTRSAPIVLNAGEKFAVNSSVAGCVFWANIIEFDALSPLARADIRNWSAGDNTLLTVPPGKTISIGAAGFTSTNQPTLNINGLSYCNNSGVSRTLAAINIVPNGSLPDTSNAFTASNTVFDGTVFSKYFHGNLGPGDFISMNSDSAAAGQFAWCNYLLADLNPESLAVPTRFITFGIRGVTLGDRPLTKIPLPFSGTIVKWILSADASTNAVINIKKNGTAICASAKPSLSAAVLNSSVTLTDWTTEISANDFLMVSVESTSGENLLLQLEIRV